MLDAGLDLDRRGARAGVREPLRRARAPRRASRAVLRDAGLTTRRPAQHPRAAARRRGRPRLAGRRSRADVADPELLGQARRDARHLRRPRAGRRPTTSTPSTPLQVAVRAGVERLTGVAVEHATVDGCGAPLFSTTLRGLARAFGSVAAAPRREPGDGRPPGSRAAMTAHPDLVGGTGRDVTRVMRAVPGLVAKDGADGVYAAGLPDGERGGAQGARRRRPAARGGPRRGARSRPAWRASRGRREALRAIALRELGRTSGPGVTARRPRSGVTSSVPSGIRPAPREGGRPAGDPRVGDRRRRRRRRAHRAGPRRAGRRHARRRRRRRPSVVARKVAELRILRDERSAVGRRGAGPRGQPVHPLRRHPQGTTPDLERRGARRRRRAARRRRRRGAAGARASRWPPASFGADMAVELVNDGPVTILLEA